MKNKETATLKLRVLRLERDLAETAGKLRLVTEACKLMNEVLTKLALNQAKQQGVLIMPVQVLFKKNEN